MSVFVSDLLKNFGIRSSCCNDSSSKTYAQGSDESCYPKQVKLKKGQAYVRLNNGRMMKFYTLLDLFEFLQSNMDDTAPLNKSSPSK